MVKNLKNHQKRTQEVQSVNYNLNLNEDIQFYTPRPPNQKKQEVEDSLIQKRRLGRQIIEQILFHKEQELNNTTHKQPAELTKTDAEFLLKQHFQNPELMRDFIRKVKQFDPEEMGSISKREMKEILIGISKQFNQVAIDQVISEFTDAQYPSLIKYSDFIVSICEKIKETREAQKILSRVEHDSSSPIKRILPYYVKPVVSKNYKKETAHWHFLYQKLIKNWNLILQDIKSFDKLNTGIININIFKQICNKYNGGLNESDFQLILSTYIRRQNAISYNDFAKNLGLSTKFEDQFHEGLKLRYQKVYQQEKKNELKKQNIRAFTQIMQQVDKRRQKTILFDNFAQIALAFDLSDELNQLGNSLKNEKGQIAYKDLLESLEKLNQLNFSQ